MLLEFNMLLDLIIQIFYSFACYAFINQLHQLGIQFYLKEEVLLYRVRIMNPAFIGSGLVLVGVKLTNNYLSLNLAIFLLYIISRFICLPDKNDVLESCKLNIGYGAAMWYYKNYLTLILPDNFLERVNTFESYNNVHVEKKLFILVPKSCIVQQYLDNDETDCIERCQELPKCEKTNSGIKNRVYNSTVYLVRNNSVKKRMLVEYAQPLKGLFAFKENKFFTKEEMFHQRKLFVESLRELLKDGKDLYKFCEIVEFSDNERKISDVLLYHCKFENSVYEIM